MMGKTRVLLINPPYNRFKGKDLPTFPLNLGYLAAFLEKHGCVVGIYNADLMKIEETTMFRTKWLGWRTDMERHSMFVQSFRSGFDYIWDEVSRVVADFNPQIVGITAITANLRPALRIADICKEIIPDVVVVIGGPHATVLPESVLTKESVDFLIRGEGELGFLDLIENLWNGMSPSEVKGLSYKDGDRMVHNATRPLIHDLDSLPFPARHLIIDSANYRESKMNGLYNQVLISRGCPYRCKFCASNILWDGSRWRTRSVTNVVEEIRLLASRYRTKDFYLWSDTFTADQRWTVEFCEEMKPLKVNWSCSTRIDRINEDCLIAMKMAGCKGVSLGIESGSDQVLKDIGKNITVGQIETAIKVLDKVGMPWYSFFIIGFPNETRSDIDRTFAFIKKLRPQSHKIAVAVPYPGTALYGEVKALNLLPEKVDWNWFDGRSMYISYVNNINRDEFIKLRDRVFTYVDRYNRRNVLKNMVREGTMMLVRDPFGLLRKLFRRVFSSL